MISEDRHNIFEDNIKQNLSDIELIGLEAVLAAFVRQHEEVTLGEAYSHKFTDYTCFGSCYVSILDGCYNTYVFDNYAIASIWTTCSGAVILECRYLTHTDYDDPYDVVRSVDWYSECKTVLFRLD